MYCSIRPMMHIDTYQYIPMHDNTHQYILQYVHGGVMEQHKRSIRYYTYQYIPIRANTTLQWAYTAQLAGSCVRASLPEVPLDPQMYVLYSRQQWRVALGASASLG